MYSKSKNICAALMFCTMGFMGLAHAEVVIIVNPANNAIIDQETIKKIFLGKTKTFPNGEQAIPIELSEGEVRKMFLKQVLRRDQSAIDSYWSRMIFTGKGAPPKAYKTEDKVRQMVATNPSLIGFIDSSKVDKTVKVINLK